MAEKEQKKKRPTAEKRMIQNKKKRLRNRSFLSSVNTAVKKLKSEIEKKESAGMEQHLRHVSGLIDKGTKKGIFHTNKAARLKSKMALACQKAK